MTRIIHNLMTIVILYRTKPPKNTKNLSNLKMHDCMSIIIYLWNWDIPGIENWWLWRWSAGWEFFECVEDKKRSTFLLS